MFRINNINNNSLSEQYRQKTIHKPTNENTSLPCHQLFTQQFISLKFFFHFLAFNFRWKPYLQILISDGNTNYLYHFFTDKNIKEVESLPPTLIF